MLASEERVKPEHPEKKLLGERREPKTIINPLSSKIHMQILQTDLHTFPSRIS